MYRNAADKLDWSIGSSLHRVFYLMGCSPLRAYLHRLAVVALMNIQDEMRDHETIEILDYRSPGLDSYMQ